MATSSSRDAARFQGMDVFWQLVKPQLQNRHEAALALAHWLLIGNGYRCVGHDIELPSSKDQGLTGSETLPEKWNDRSAGFYSLLYVHPEHPLNMFLLKLIPAGSIEDEMILGQVVMSGSNDDVIPFEMESHKYIPDQWKDYSSPTSFPNFKAFTDVVDKEIISKIQSRKRTEGSGVGAASRPDPGSGGFPGQGMSQPQASRPSPFAPLPAPPLSEFVPPGRGYPVGIGSRDLDPFSGFGGNVFGPRDIFPGGLPGSGNLPARPYRYDPVGPPEFYPRAGGFNSPFHPPSSGMGPGFPGSSGPGGAFGPNQPGFNPLFQGPAPTFRPFEPDPDHELPPRAPGDDPTNMFM